jgi:DNA-binding NtrC family response regulator
MTDAILLIDDDPKVLEALAMVLEDAGHAVERFTDPRRGLEAVWEFRPRLVITDLMMPVMGGFEVLHRVKKIDPAIQVVVITGYGSVAEAVAAMREGAFDFIRKPFNSVLIEAVVRRALEAASRE